MEAGSPSTSYEQRIVDEFLFLVDRSTQFFAGLRFKLRTYSSAKLYRSVSFRELQPFGKQWQPYFQKCFEIYTRVRTKREINVLLTSQK
jgi:hypothetical protein